MARRKAGTPAGAPRPKGVSACASGAPQDFDLSAVFRVFEACDGLTQHGQWIVGSMGSAYVERFLSTGLD